MNIGFFYMHPPNESMGSLYRIMNLCKGLASLSHKCYIFTPFDYFIDWGPFVKFINIQTARTRKKTSTLIYKTTRKVLDTKFISKYTILNRSILDYTIKKLANDLYNSIKGNPIQLDVIIGETEIGGLVLIKNKNKLKIPIIVDYQNYWPEELVEQKVIKRTSKKYNFLVDLERHVINNADFILTPSQTLKDFINEQFNKEKNIKIGVVINGGQPVLEKPKMKKVPPKIINAGMVVHRSNYELFIKSIPYILEKYPDAEIYITKKGEELKEILRLVKKYDIKVNFYWKETYQEFLEFLSECNVGVVTSSDELTRKLGFVTKIYDYFSVGVPVVGNDIGGWTKIITEEKVGTLSFNDPKDLAVKIIEFIDNPEMAYEYGERGIYLLKNKYTIKNAANQLLNYIETM